MALVIPLEVSASPQTVPLDVATPVEQTVNGDYEQLANLPQINGVTLIGDKSADDLGLVDADDYAPVDKTEAMTQPVGKDANGKLYTTPSAGNVESVNGQTGVVALDAQDVGALPSDADLDDIADGTTYKRATASQIAQIATNAQDIADIQELIPASASANNQLADKAFVNSSVQTNTAHFRGNWPTWADVPTNAADYPADDDGNTTPTTNDYMVIQDAADYPVAAGEDALSGTWRFKYTGLWVANGRAGWRPEYQVNETPLTAAQLAALNSGATAEIISSVADKLGKTGDGSDVTVAFSAASSRANIATGEKLSVIFGKIAKWFSDIKSAAFRDATSSISSGSTDLVESGAVYTGLAGKQAKITASGILKGDGNGGVSGAVAGTDYQAPLTAGTDYATPGQIPTVPSAYTSNPAALGTASPGSSTYWARGDHVHPKPTASDIGACPTVQQGTISLSATWSGSGPYTQPVTVTGATVTSNSKIDLQPDASVLAQLISDGVTALFVTNNNGTLTATAIGAETTAALTIQCTVTEVTA